MKTWDPEEDVFLFESILYFALINCDIVTSLDEKSFIQEIKSIANRTGFIDFSVVGIDDFQIQYLELISVINLRVESSP